jgi:major vault protein
MVEPGMQRENEFVLAPGEYVYTSDQTTGRINAYVGPYKMSLAGTDQPMIFDANTQKYERARTVKEAVKNFPYADERAYIVLQNPSKDENEQYPKIGTSCPQAQLHYGRKINVKGPGTYPLWPGQSATVIAGHQLKSNQYLIVKIYNAEEANKNWQDSVMESVAGATKEEKPDLIIGQLLIIKGTDVSFYIPPTGIEVVPESNGNYVRDAVTLERMEYSILLDESGEKRYVRGPVVVFPSPTEKFIELNGVKKFRALELNAQMGIHVKVIADYTENGKSYKAGDELHITGETQRIYYPRQEHALIKYNDATIQYALAITAGEGRYVLDKDTGNVETVKGPKMFLPNPLNQVLVNRILSDKEVSLWFPGNREAVEYNRSLYQQAQEINRSAMADVISNTSGTVLYAATPTASSGFAASLSKRSMSSNTMEAMSDFATAGDQVKRKTAFTPPRSITLDNKYNGSVRIDVWPGYAVQVVSKTGEREVVNGPKTIILDYDQTLEILSLSRGVPKSTDSILNTPYLKVKNNQITDVVQATSSDLVDVGFKVSYRVNFEGEPSKWFETENYVKLLTDHLRSLIRSAIKEYGIEKINDDHISIIRDIVLGANTDGKREGRLFEENGMHVYDVEVFNCRIGDDHIATMLSSNQHEIVRTTLEIAQKKSILEASKQIETCVQQMEMLTSATRMVHLSTIKTEQDAKAEIDRSVLVNKENQQKTLDAIAVAELAREKSSTDQKLDSEARLVEIRKMADIDRIKAISPDLVSAIQNAYSMGLAEKVAENLPNAAGAFGLLTGNGGLDSVAKLFEGTPISDAFKFVGTPKKKADK